MTETPGQPDGYYPRLNSKMIKSGSYQGMIVSVVGSLTPNSTPNGKNLIELKCVDGGIVNLMVEPDFGAAINFDPFIEVIGMMVGDNILQYFVSRGFGDDFDVDTYNEMIQMQVDPKFKEIFGHTDLK